MKELVLFYSYSGSTKKIAQKFSQENKFDICEVVDKKRPNKFYAYTAGILKTFRGAEIPVEPLVLNSAPVNFADYGVVNIFSPVWADHVTPSMTGALKMIPKNTKIKLFMVSATGKSGKDSMSKRVQDLGLEIVGYEDIKADKQKK